MPDLHDIFWRALDGPQAHLSEGTATARRFARGLPPIIAFADPRDPDFEALAPFCMPGETFYCAEWDGPQPAGWTIELDARMVAMPWRGVPGPGDWLGSVRLGEAHVGQMRELAAQTRPGPFADRPMELGEWHGVIEEGRLVAMAGERVHADGLREISGVCTAPGFQGRGFARRLTEVLVRIQLSRGQTPFLHVASSNERARALYEGMGFVPARELPMRIVTRNPDA